jgi:hypothetical protein
MKKLSLLILLPFSVAGLYSAIDPHLTTGYSDVDEMLRDHMQLFNALSNNNMEEVEYYLARHVVDKHILGLFLNYAASEIHGPEGIAIVDLLVTAGADPNFIDHNCFMTPLIEVKRPEIALTLAAHGARFDLHNSYNVGPLWVYINTFGTEEEALPLVQIALEHGADPHARNIMGFTPMEAAHEREFHTIIELFSSRS